MGLLRVQALHNLRRVDPTFPAPVWSASTQGGLGALWCWPEVQRWAKASGRELAPRPREPGVDRRYVDLDNLVGSQAIADRLGVRFVERIYAMRREDPTFPAPVFSSLPGAFAKRLWSWPDVWRWAKHCGRVFPVPLGRYPSSMLRS